MKKVRYVQGLVLLAALFLPVAYAQESVTVDEFDELADELEALKQQVTNLSLGTTKAIVSGYAFAGYRDHEGKDSTFFAGFNPILAWKLTEDVFFEGELELELDDGETEVNLEYAHLVYFLNDYMTFGAGKFLTPFNIFGERLHPAWINKLPTRPLYAGHGGLLPMTQVGVDLRGGWAINNFKINYAAYVTDGFKLGTEDHEAGVLETGNFDDNNNNKTFGGRLGLLPIPFIEFGVSYLTGQVSDKGDEKVDAQLWGADFTFARDVEAIYGFVDVRVEYVQQDIDHRLYVDGADTFDFDNEKTGWYGQIAYRPSKVKADIIKDLEVVFRYSVVDYPEGTPAQEEGEAFDQSDITIGLNYWVGPSTVFKMAYTIDDVDKPGEDVDKFTFQFAIGF